MSWRVRNLVRTGAGLGMRMSHAWVIVISCGVLAAAHVAGFDIVIYRYQCGVTSSKMAPLGHTV